MADSRAVFGNPDYDARFDPSSHAFDPAWVKAHPAVPKTAAEIKTEADAKAAADARVAAQAKKEVVFASKAPLPVGYVEVFKPLDPRDDPTDARYDPHKAEKDEADAEVAAAQIVLDKAIAKRKALQTQPVSQRQE